MSQSANKAHRAAGFTLVEVMTTLAVIGLVAGAVMLAAPGSDTRLRSDVERFAARLKLASDQSVLTNRDIALVSAAEGYHFEQLSEEGWRRIENVEPLGFHPWPGERAPQVKEGGQDRLTEFDAIGGAEPVSLLFGDPVPSWRVEIDEAGAIRVDRAN
jgi:type II secretion system protein H